MKKILLLLISITVIIFLFTQIDDDLSAESRELVERIPTGGHSEAYLFLTGIYVNTDENPVDVGRRQLEDSRRLEADSSYTVVDYEDSKKLPLPEGDAFCKSWEDSCLKTLFSSAIGIDKLLTRHELLVSRSNQFLEYKEYQTLASPTLAEVFPPFQYVAAAERLKVLRAISNYKNGSSEDAIKSLLMQVSQLRQSMALQDNLIGKLVFLMKISEVIDVASVILHKEGIKVEALSSLSQSEKSYYMIAAREFGILYYGFKDLYKNAGFIELGEVPEWCVRILYKPNMTINALQPRYSKLESLAKLSPANFSKEIEGDNQRPIYSSTLRNYMGGIFVNIAEPNFVEYLARFSDLDVKIALFNHKHSANNALINPYYSTFDADEIDGSLCFNGPLEDKRKIRCLKMEI